MPLVTPIPDLADPRLDDYRVVRDRQWTAPFSYADARSPDSEAPWGKFMAEGQTVFDKLLLDPAPPVQKCRVLSVLCTPTRLEALAPALARLPASTPVYVVPAAQVEALVGFNMHRGLLAIVARPAPLGLGDLVPLVRPGAPLIVLDEVFNHDNIGSIFRSGAALGAAGVLLSPGCADPLYRKGVRVGVGSMLLVPWAYARSWPGDARALRDAGCRLVALARTPRSIDLRELPSRLDVSRQRLALLLGSEGPGLSPDLLSAADVHVEIPMHRGIDSLNVGVAAGIALQALARGDPVQPNSSK